MSGTLRRAGAMAAVCACVAGCGGSGHATATPAATSAGGSHRPARDAALARGLDRELWRSARAAGASGATAAVVDRGRLVWAGSSGAARTPGAVFTIASLTKSFVAALVLRRVEQGRLSLDDTVRSRLGDAVPADVGSATVRELLGHTSGLADYLGDPAVEAAAADRRHRWSEAELLRAIHRAGPPGSFSYANANYVLLGAILRRVGRRRTGAQLRAEVLRPLGLDRTSLDRERTLARRFVGGVRPDTDRWGELFSDGGMAGTAPDVARFFDALLVGGRLLRAATLRRMTTPGPSGTYGLGLGTARLGSCRLWGNTGFYTGWISAALTERRAGVTTVVLLQGGRRGDAKRILLRLLKRLRRSGEVDC